MAGGHEITREGEVSRRALVMRAREHLESKGLQLHVPRSQSHTDLAHGTFYITRQGSSDIVRSNLTLEALVLEYQLLPPGQRIETAEGRSKRTTVSSRPPGKPDE